LKNEKKGCGRYIFKDGQSNIACLTFCSEYVLCNCLIKNPIFLHLGGMWLVQPRPVGLEVPKCLFRILLFITLFPCCENPRQHEEAICGYSDWHSLLSPVTKSPQPRCQTYAGKSLCMTPNPCCSNQPQHIIETRHLSVFCLNSWITASVRKINYFSFFEQSLCSNGK
jgi:hypothetical protein